MKKNILFIFIFLFSSIGFSQNNPIKIATNNIKKITKIDIKEAITESTARRVSRSLDAAKAAKSDLIIIEMDTYGGGLYDADAIRKKILSFEKPVWVLSIKVRFLVVLLLLLLVIAFICREVQVLAQQLS